MSRSKNSQRISLIGHSRKYQKIRFCAFAIALIFLTLTISFCTNKDLILNSENSNPRASIRTITGIITLTSISDSFASDGEDVTVYGNAQKWNGVAWDAYVGEIVLVVNTVRLLSETTTSNGVGDFGLTFTMDTTNFHPGTNNIQANTTEGGYDTNCTNYMTVDLVSGADIIIHNTMDPQLSGTSTYQISGVVHDSLTGAPYSDPSGFELEFYYGDTITGTQGPNVTVLPDGSITGTVPHNPSYTSFTLYWPGSSSLSPDETTAGFNVITDIDVRLSSISRTIYENTTVTISGTIYNQDRTYPLVYSYITITIAGPYLNEILFNGTLDVGGQIPLTTYDVPTEVAGTYTITVTVNTYYANGVSVPVPGGLLVHTQEVRIRKQTVFTNIPWEFIVIGVAAAGAIVGVFFLQRWLMGRRVQKDRSLIAKEIEDRLNNVRLLYQMGRVKEALAYLYVTYTEIAEFRHGIAKQASQTTTEFAILMVKQYGQNPQNIYPFIQEIEQVIYGGYPYNDQVFMHSVELFGRIYLELMEKPLPSFQLS